MLRPSIYSWFSAYRAASLEPDFTLVPGRVREALRVIHDRLNDPSRLDEQERQAIATLARVGKAQRRVGQRMGRPDHRQTYVRLAMLASHKG
jgi:hypothetical protein